MKKIFRSYNNFVLISFALILIFTLMFSTQTSNIQNLNSLDNITPKSAAVHHITGNSELASVAATMGGGSGTQNDPYVLYYDPINASSNYTGLVIQNTTKYAILNNTKIYGADLGTGYNIANLNLSSVENFIINNCTFYDSNLDGIFIENATNIIITNTNCSNNGRMDEAFITGEGAGLNIKNSDLISISNSHFSTNSFSGIELNNVNNSIFTSNNLTENKVFAEFTEEVVGFGLYAVDCNIISVIDNNVSKNWLRGIHGINLNDMIFESNLVSYNGLSEFYECHGVYIQNSMYIELISNNISKNFEDGIFMENSNRSIIKDNFVRENGLSGIYNNDCFNNSVFQNNLIMNNDGIKNTYGQEIHIFQNNITNSNFSGMSISFTDHINIEQNIISGCDLGFNLQWCDNSNFSLNSLNNCGGPGSWEASFYLSSADNNNFNRNIVNNSDGYDFYMSNSELNSIYGNYLFNKSYDSNQDQNYWNSIDYGNYWNNYSVYYPGAIANNGIYDTPYDRIYNDTSSFGNASDYLPLTLDYWQEIYDETSNTSEPIPQDFVPPTPILDPINLTDDDGSFRLSWQAVEGALNYSIYYNSTNPQSSGSFAYLITPISSIDGMDLLATVETTFYDVTGLSNGTYYFVIIANNESGSSEPSEILSVSVQIPPEEESKPFFTPIIVLGSFIGAALGAVAINFIPSDKIVDFLKETRDKLKKSSQSDVKSDNKGDIKSEPDGDVQTTEEPISLEENVPIVTEIDWQRYIRILEYIWNYLPKNLRDMLLNVVDKYLKFRDEAELIILNSFHALSLGYLSLFNLYRTGDTNKCISTLDEITQEAQKAEFQNLSEEAKITKEEFKTPIEEINKGEDDLE